MRIRLYGCLADVLGPQIELPVEGCSVGDVRRRLTASHAAAAGALNRSFALVRDLAVGDDHPLCEGDELEFLPPVSGG